MGRKGRWIADLHWAGLSAGFFSSAAGLSLRKPYAQSLRTLTRPRSAAHPPFDRRFDKSASRQLKTLALRLSDVSVQ